MALLIFSAKPRLLLLVISSLASVDLVDSKIGLEFYEARFEFLFQRVAQLTELVKNNTEEMQSFQRNIQSQLEERFQKLTNLVENESKAVYQKQHAAQIQFENNEILSIIPLCQQPNATTLVCKSKSSGGGWIVVQQRFYGSVDFNRTWKEYRNGFGTVGPSSEFWLGLERLHQLTKTGAYELLIELKDHYGDYRFARYSDFVVEGEPDRYRLAKLGGYSGTAGDVNRLKANWVFTGQKFSTFDSDSDRDAGSCATVFGGGWWYNDCGDGLNERWENMTWRGWKSAILRYTRMLVRAKA